VRSSLGFASLRAGRLAAVRSSLGFASLRAGRFADGDRDGVRSGVRIRVARRADSS